LVPKLGVVRVGDFKSFVVADIPGLVKGAHQGVGLGLRFLRHLSRSKLILHLVDLSLNVEDIEKAVIDLIDGDQTIWENEPLTKLANKKELCAYCHSGFWRPMDTLRDKTTLNDLWSKDQAPWKKW